MGKLLSFFLVIGVAYMGNLTAQGYLERAAAERNDNETVETVYCPHVEQTVVYNVSLSCDLDQNIDHLTTEVSRKALQLMHLAWEQGPYSIRVYETRRGLCRQTKLFKEGTTQKLNSSHVIGEAFDIVFDIEGQPSWGEWHPWEQIGLIGESLGLVWGGRWENFPDYGHFELPTAPIE